MNLLSVYARFLRALFVWVFLLPFIVVTIVVEEYLTGATLPFLIEIDRSNYDFFLWLFYGVVGYFLFRSFPRLSKETEKLSKKQLSYEHRLSRHYTREQQKEDIEKLHHVAVTSILWNFTIPRILFSVVLIHALALVFTHFMFGIYTGLAGGVLYFVMTTASKQRRWIMRSEVRMDQGDIERRNRIEQEELRGFIDRQRTRHGQRGSPQSALGLLFPFLDDGKRGTPQIPPGDTDDSKTSDRPF